MATARGAMEATIFLSCASFRQQT